LVSSVFIFNKLCIGGDFNVYVGYTIVGFDEMWGVSGMKVETKKMRVS
jgi:hypothetical protein